MVLYSAANSTDVVGLLQYVNRVTCFDRTNMTDIAVTCATDGGILGVMIPIAVFMISFLALMPYQEKGIVTALFLTTLTTYFLFILSLTSNAILILVTVAFLGSVFFIKDRGV